MAKRDREARPVESAREAPRPRDSHRAILAALLALVVFAPLYFTTSLSDYNTPKLALVQVLTTLACAFWFSAMALEGRLYLVRTQLYYALLAFMAANFISLFQAYNRPQGLETMFQYLCQFLLCLVVYNCVTAERGGRFLVAAITGTASVIAVIGLLQYNRVYDFSAQWSLPVSTLGNVTYVAEYLDVGLPVAVGMALAWRGPSRYAAGLGAVLMIGLIAVLGSRGGWIGVGVSSGVFVAAWVWRLGSRESWNLRGSALKIAAALAVVLILVLGLPRLPAGKGVTVGKVLEDRWTAIFQRSESAARLQDESSRQRVLIWKDTVRMILDRPLLGVGVGNFAYTLPKYASRESAESLDRMRKAAGTDLAVYQAHNGYLEVLAETGILGLGAFAWMFYAVCGMYFRLIRAYARGETGILSIGLAAAAGATLVHALFSLNFQNPASASHFWIVTGLAASIEAGTRGRPERIPLLDTRSGAATPAVIGASIAVVLLAAVTSYSALAADYYYNEGRYDLKATPKRTDRARANFARSVSHRPYSFAAQQMLGNACVELGLWAEAETAYRKSLRCHPGNRMAHKLLGEVLMRMGRFEEAAESFRAAVRLDPLFAEAFHRLGFCERQLGRNDEAIRAHLQATSLEPANPDYLNSLGAARIAAGDYTGAIADLNRAAAIRPGDAGVQINLGIASFLGGRSRQALDHYEKAVSLDPREPNAHALIGQVYQEALKDTVRALEQYRKALAIRPADERIQALLRNLERR